MIAAFVTAGAGFLLAVLWFDLMFDVQVRGRGEPSDEALASIAAYYRRVTLQARPMNRLVALVMAWTIGSLIAEATGDEVARWRAVACLVLVAGAAGLALLHTFGNGARLGAGRQPRERQVVLARLMLRDHLLCLVAIVSVLALQLSA